MSSAWLCGTVLLRATAPPPVTGETMSYETGKCDREACSNREFRL